MASYLTNFRKRTRPRQDNENEDDDSAGLIDFSDRSSGKLTADFLLTSDPEHHGYLWKRSRKPLTHLFGSRCCADEWKERLFVLSGAYLFRYASDASERPKGVPLPIESISCRCATMEEEEEAPENFRGVGLVISTVRKEYFLRAEDQQSRDQWLRILNNARQRVIRENLGHATVNPKHRSINAVGARLFGKRVKEDAAATGTPSPSSIELTMLSGGHPSTFS